MNVASMYTLTTGLTPVGQVWPGPIDGETPPPANGNGVPLPPCAPTSQEQELQCVGAVREREGIGRHTVAGLLGISDSELQRQEQPQSDMLLSQLYRWSKALQVPASELLSEPAIGLSPPVRLRAQLVRAMKTVRLIEERTRQPSIKRLITALVDQFAEIMPELRTVGAWPVLGKRRMPKDPGQAYFRGLAMGGLEESHDGET